MSTSKKATHEMVLQLPEQFRFTRGDASHHSNKQTSARQECLAELVPWAESFLNQPGNGAQRVVIYRFVSHIMKQLGEFPPTARDFVDGDGI